MQRQANNSQLRGCTVAPLDIRDVWAQEWLLTAVGRHPGNEAEMLLLNEYDVRELTRNTLDKGL